MKKIISIFIFLLAAEAHTAQSLAFDPNYITDLNKIEDLQEAKESVKSFLATAHPQYTQKVEKIEVSENVLIGIGNALLDYYLQIYPPTFGYWKTVSYRKAVAQNYEKEMLNDIEKGNEPEMFHFGFTPKIIIFISQIHIPKTQPSLDYYIEIIRLLDTEQSIHSRAISIFDHTRQYVATRNALNLSTEIIKPIYLELLARNISISKVSNPALDKSKTEELWARFRKTEPEKVYIFY